MNTVPPAGGGGPHQGGTTVMIVVSVPGKLSRDLPIGTSAASSNRRESTGGRGEYLRNHHRASERADDGGYGAWSPDLPGCVALGDTEEETLSEMKEAMRGHL
ncbi:MAG: type II toxin-antitoxin system HicB family antitoxin, partial [Pseudonocardiaceae bacterium]